MAVSLDLVKMDDRSVFKVLWDCLMLSDKLEQLVGFLCHSCISFFVDFSRHGVFARCFATA